VLLLQVSLDLWQQSVLLLLLLLVVLVVMAGAVAAVSAAAPRTVAAGSRRRRGGGDSNCGALLLALSCNASCMQLPPQLKQQLQHLPAIQGC
jgi:hypothetical protein